MRKLHLGRWRCPSGNAVDVYLTVAAGADAGVGHEAWASSTYQGACNRHSFCRFETTRR